MGIVIQKKNKYFLLHWCRDWENIRRTCLFSKPSIYLKRSASHNLCYHGKPSQRPQKYQKNVIRQLNSFRNKIIHIYNTDPSLERNIRNLNKKMTLCICSIALVCLFLNVTNLYNVHFRQSSVLCRCICPLGIDILYFSNALGCHHYSSFDLCGEQCVDILIHIYLFLSVRMPPQLSVQNYKPYFFKYIFRTMLFGMITTMSKEFTELWLICLIISVFLQ